jgi:hypothetical protein
MTAYSNICGQGLEFKVLCSSRLPSHSQIFYFPGKNTLAYRSKSIGDEEKKAYDIDTRCPGARREYCLSLDLLLML